MCTTKGAEHCPPAPSFRIPLWVRNLPILGRIAISVLLFGGLLGHFLTRIPRPFHASRESVRHLKGVRHLSIEPQANNLRLTLDWLPAISPAG